MPRNVKESDDELETKGGRRTRTTLNPSVLDSPLRRSTRIRQPQAQNDSSPDSNSDVSSAGGTRTTRRRTTALDGTIPETTRNLRTRRNSATSDISELAENDLAGESTGKRITRRSIASLPSVQTPTKLRASARRASRAGSETKSTPPVARITRRTRASSMEPEATEDTKIQDPGTPLKSRRRASALPSEPAVAEESEDVRMEKTVYEIDEDESEISHNVSKTLRRKSKGDLSEDEKMEVDESPVVESDVDTIERSFRHNTVTPPLIVITQVPRKLEDSMKIPDSMENDEKFENSMKHRDSFSPVKSSAYTIENLLSNKTDSQEKSPGNKENEIFTTINDSMEKKIITQSTGELPFSSRTSLLNSSLTKITEKRSSISNDDETSSICSESKITTTKIYENIPLDADITKDPTTMKKDYSLDVKCVVMIESLNAEKIASLKSDSSKILYKQQQQKVSLLNENDKENLQTTEDNENNEEITVDVGTMMITNVVSMASKEEAEHQRDDDEDDEDDDDDDDIQIIEITDPTINMNLEKMVEKSTINEETTNVISSNDKSMEETINLETTLNQENPKILENNEVTIVFDDTTSLNSEEPKRRTSMISEDVTKISKDNEKILWETASPSAKKMMIETSNDEEVAKESNENNENLCETSPRPKTTISEKSINEEVVQESKNNDEISCETTSPRPKTTIPEKSIDKEVSQESKNNDELSCETTSSIAKTTITEKSNEPEVVEESKDNDEIETTSTTEKTTITEKSIDEKDEESKENAEISCETTSSGEKSIILEISMDEEDSSKSQQEIASFPIASPQALKTINRRISMDEKITKISTDINNEENIICDIVKDRKSSIVTESPTTSGTNTEEISQLCESNVIEETTINAATSRKVIDEQQPDNIDVNVEKTTKIRENVEIRVFDSDNESETINCPSFKDITADEWTKQRDVNNDDKNNHDGDSIHSFSTERNESECELALVDKEPWQQQLNQDRREKIVKNGNYDSDDTVIARNDNNQCIDDEIGNDLIDDEVPIDLSSDEEQNKDERSNLNASSSKKRASLNNSKKFSNKNEENVENNSEDKDSSCIFNVSRRKSSLNLDNDFNDESSINPAVNLSNRSMNKSAKKRSLNARRTIDNSSENEDYTNVSMKNTPKSLETRKSLVNSSRRLSDVNSLNTSKTEKRKSLDKSLVENDENTIEKEIAHEENSDSENNDLKIIENDTTKNTESAKVLGEKINKLETSRQEKEKSPTKLNRSSKSENNRKSLNKNNSKILQKSSESEIEEEEEEENSQPRLNRSSKSENNRKSLNNKNNSKIPEKSSESEIEEEEEEENSQSKLNKSSKSENNRKSLNKNNSKILEKSSESEIEEEEEEENSQSKLNKSSKSENNRKSLNKNNSKILEQSSESEIEEEEEEEEENSQPKLNRSSKSENNRKSLNKNNSKILEKSSESEIEAEEEEENSQSKLNKSSKSENNRKSLNKNNSKILEKSSESEIEAEEEENSQSKLNKSSKSENNRKSLNKNNSKILENSSESEIEEEEEEENSQPKLNRSSKSENNRKSLNKNNSKILEKNSESEIEEEEEEEHSPSKLNKSSKSEKNRKSLNSNNNSRIKQQDSDSLDEDNEILSSKLNQSKSKSAKTRKSLNSPNNSRIMQQSSDSEIELEDLHRKNDRISSQNRRSSINKNNSFVKPINSDSDVKIDDESDEFNVDSCKIPKFLYDANTSSDEDSEKSIDSDVANEMNLHGKSSLKYSDDDVPADDCMATESESLDSEDDDGADLIDFVVDDDDDDEEEEDSSDDETNEKTRKRIISRPGGDSDTLGSDESEEIDEIEKIKFNDKNHDNIIFDNDESLKLKITKTDNSLAVQSDNEVFQPREISSIVNTPKQSKKRDTSMKTNETEEIIDLNESSKKSAKKNKQTLLDTSTPKLASRENLSSKKSTKSDRSMKLETPTSKIDTSRKSEKFEDILDNDTPKKLAKSFNEAKTPKTPKTSLQTSLTQRLNDSANKTNLSSVKSPKLSKLCKTMIVPSVESPEARYLMKEKLNDTLPALKLQRRSKELRRSVLDNLHEENVIENEIIVDENVTTKDNTIGEEIVETEYVDSEKKKKKKKKNKKKGANESNDITEESINETTNEIFSLVNESKKSPVADDTMNESKKRKRNKKNIETMENEEARLEEDENSPKKNKKLKKNVTIMEQEIPEDVETVEKKNKKKNKKKKLVEFVEDEITICPTKNNVSSVITSESMPEEESRGNDEQTMKNEQSDISISRQRPRQIKTRSMRNMEKLSTSIKRLPDDVIESLDEISARPKKRRKIVEEEKILPSKSMIVPGCAPLRNIEINDDFISISNSGGTTQFGIVDLEKITKKSKKSIAAQSFRERMLARNPRQPVSAYLMYQQKQKAAGKDQRY